MDWSDLIARADWRCEPLAFLFVADVGIFVENTAFGLNPGMSLGSLQSVLRPVPGWLSAADSRLLLRDGWPQIEGESVEELTYLALMSAKSMLAVGSIVPDASLEQMTEGFDRLFPEFARARTADGADRFSSFEFYVAIGADGPHETKFGYSMGRSGRDLPIGDPHLPFTGRPNTWTRWEVAMKNLLRLELQRQIETRRTPTVWRA